MSDWKSALKALKKEMFGVKGEGETPKKVPKTEVPTLALKPGNMPFVALTPSAELRDKVAKVGFPNSSQPSAKPKVQVQRPMAPKIMSQSPPKPLSIQQAPKVHTPLVPPSSKKPSGVPKAFQTHWRSNLTRQDNFKFPDACG